LMSECTRW